VCTPGLYTGTDCNTPIPPTDKVEVVVYVSFCQQAPCTAFTDEQVKLLLVSLSGVGREHLTVSSYTTKKERQCCTYFKVVLTGTKGEFDGDGTKAQLEAGIASDNRFATESPETTTQSGSAILAVSTVLLMLLALLF